VNSFQFSGGNGSRLCFQIVSLSGDHSFGSACGSCNFRNQSHSFGCRKLIVLRNCFERHRQQRIAGENRSCFAKAHVTSGPPAAQIVIVHRGQIIVDQRISVDHFQRAGGSDERLALRSKCFTHSEQQRGAKAFAAGELNFFSEHRHLHEPAAFRRYLTPAWNAEWVVYAKPPFAGPAQVLDYVGRYTHRVAISNNRLVSMDNDKVRFRWKDYRDGSRQKTMTLQGGEFIRRFLIHVLPDGFHRIRYYA